MEHNPRVVFERMFGDGGSTDPPPAGPGPSGAAASSTRPRQGGGPEPRPWPERRGAAARVPRRGARHRAAHPAGRGAGGARAAGVRPADGGARRLRGPRAAHVRPAGARVAERPHPGRHVHGRPRVQQPHLSRDRRPPAAPPPVARGQCGEPRAARPHQQAPRRAVRLLRRPPRRDPDGDGSLLDHAIVYYGAGMAEGDHRPWNLPLVVAGGGGDGSPAAGTSGTRAGPAAAGRSTGAPPSRTCT